MLIIEENPEQLAERVSEAKEIAYRKKFHLGQLHEKELGTTLDSNLFLKNRAKEVESIDGDIATLARIEATCLEGKKIILFPDELETIKRY